MALLDIVTQKLAEVAAFHDHSIVYIRSRISGELDAEGVESIEELSADSLALLDRLLDCELNDHNETGGRKRIRFTMANTSLNALLARLSPDALERVTAFVRAELTVNANDPAGLTEAAAEQQLTADERKMARTHGGCVAFLTAKRAHEAQLVAAENEARIPNDKLALLKVLCGPDPIAIRDRWNATRGVGLGDELAKKAGPNVAGPNMPLFGKGR